MNLLDSAGQEEKKDNERHIIPVVEEELSISKRVVETGTVRVRLHTQEVAEQVATERISHSAHINRRPVDIRVEAEYPPHQEGDEWVIPVFEYKSVVTMQLFLKEEVRIARRTETTPETLDVTLKRQDVIVERRQTGSDEWCVIDS